MYIRFVINSIDEDSGKRSGIFHAIRELRDKGELLSHETKLLDEVRDWFNDNLDAPDSFSRVRRRNAQAKAISWYKDTAREHISKMHEIVTVLEAHGLQVDVLTTQRPGYIVFEDDCQVAAEPFKETET